MRFVILILLTGLIFTTSQVAVAYERCDKPQCAGFMSDAGKQEQNKKAEKAVHHCCSVHVIEVAPLDQSAANVSITDKKTWQLVTSFASHIPSALYEPPSTL